MVTLRFGSNISARDLELARRSRSLHGVNCVTFSAFNLKTTERPDVIGGYVAYTIGEKLLSELPIETKLDPLADPSPNRTLANHNRELNKAY